MLSGRLRECRERCAMTQNEAAGRLGITRQAYNNYEVGRRVPPAAMLSRLAAMYKVSTDYLLGRETAPPPVNGDDELTGLLEELKSRDDMRMLFKLARNATREDVLTAIRIIEALRSRQGD